MLKKALKLDQVHTFGDLSMSQLLEKIDYVVEMIFLNQIKNTQAKTKILITIISLAKNGILAESNSVHKKVYEREVEEEILVSNDLT